MRMRHRRKMEALCYESSIAAPVVSSLCSSGKQSTHNTIVFPLSSLNLLCSVLKTSGLAESFI